MIRRRTTSAGEILKKHSIGTSDDPVLEPQGKAPEGKSKFLEERVRQDFTSLFHLSIINVQVRFDDAHARQYKGMEGSFNPNPTGFTIMQDNAYDKISGATIAYSVLENKKSSTDNSIAGRIAKLLSEEGVDRTPVSVDLLRAWVQNPNLFPEVYKRTPGIRYYIPGTLIRGETVRIPYVTYEGGVVQCALAHMATPWDAERDRLLFYKR